MTLLAAFDSLLHYYTGQDDILVGTPIANRVRTETESMIGFFVNALVMRTDLSGNPTFEELLKRVRETCLGAYANQDLPFEQLVQELRPERISSQQPLFQASFVLQNIPPRSLSLPDLTISPLSASWGRPQFDLILQVVDRKATLALSLRYNTALFTPTRIKHMGEDYDNLLQRIIAQPDIRLDALHESLLEANRKRTVIQKEELRESRLRNLRGMKKR
jgi:non-ribosomal peptide synthetase component F